jgi:hypothetical protein
VKTTNGWERTPLHISRNELAVADERREEWRLFRLWNLARTPKAFELRPRLMRMCRSRRPAFEQAFTNFFDESRPESSASMEREIKGLRHLARNWLL